MLFRWRGVDGILRHDAIKAGLKIRSDGYVVLDDFLKMNKFKKWNIGVTDIEEIVAENGKKRF